MRVTLHLCMPEGDAMRQRFSDLMEIQKRDNRGVIAAMMANGIEIPDTVGDLGLKYVPEQHRVDDRGQPIMDIYGIRDMVERNAFSCGCAAAYEAAVMEEKYGVPTLCLSVAQGEDDLHAIFVTSKSVIDPVANYFSGHRPPIPSSPVYVQESACIIGDDGRVVCVEDEVCAVDEQGRWDCPGVPGLTGRRATIGNIHTTANGAAWARTPEGAVVPVRRRS